MGHLVRRTARCRLALVLLLGGAAWLLPDVALDADAGDPAFWAFRKPLKPQVPDSGASLPGRRGDGQRTPVDAFIDARLAANGLSPAPEAGRRVLIRRLSFDLLGLPPGPEEVERFERDPAPDACERLVDRLLASPRYGERWGRHWLDVAGYADSNGILVDRVVPETWRYRDWVIRALNQDRPYDRFLLEQFAGDELVDWRDAEAMTDEMAEALTATGFLRCTPDGTDNQNIFQLDKRWDRLQVALEVAMKAAIGLTLNCARCHDHKYDPITQAEYYGLLAMLTPAYDPENWVPSNDFRKYVWPVRYVLRAGADERRAIDEAFAVLPGRIREAKERMESASGTADANAASAELAAAEAELAEWKKRVGGLDQLWALWDVSPTPSPTRLLIRGDFTTPGEPVEPGVPAALDDGTDPFTLPPPGDASSGRRLALARWLVRPDHPLTARVLVNRVWHYHLGEGIVRTPDDFGSQGARPTHPQLLDWLAVRFVESGRSLKRLHRLVVTSGVYRRSAVTDAPNATADPENRLLWRRRPRRLEAESIRDAMLAAGGALDCAIGGPPVPVEKTADGQFVVDPEHRGARRRSVYVLNRRTTLVSFLEVFDAPAMDTNQPRRFASNVPSQALALLNNPFVIEAARTFAARLRLEAPEGGPARVERAFRIAFGRAPAEREGELALALVGGGGSEGTEDWETLCQGLLAANEFLYVE